MKFLLLVVAVGVTIGSCFGASLERTSPNELLLAEWQEFKTTHGKVYADSQEEDRRFQLYLATRFAVAKHNNEQTLGLHTYRQAVNKFADIETSEFLGLPTQINSSGIPTVQGCSQYSINSVGDDPPASIDWRQTGDISPVKDQGTQCNAGWAFATIAGLESMLAVGNKKKNLSLSEQQLIDCSYENKGCVDGDVKSGGNYLVYAGGAESENTYSYTGKQGECRFDRSKIAGFTNCLGWGGAPDEDTMKEEISRQPEQVGMYVSDSLKQYSHGIYSDSECSKAKTYHYVLVVGYGSDAKDGDHWIVKNSWGTNWGESGYVRIARNKGNICGIANLRVAFCYELPSAMAKH